MIARTIKHRVTESIQSPNRIALHNRDASLLKLREIHQMCAIAAERSLKREEKKTLSVTKRDSYGRPIVQEAGS